MSEEVQSAAIQPIGFLVSLSSDWRISAVSANIGDYFGANPEKLLGQPVTRLFSPGAIHSLRNRLALLRGGNATERLFSIPLTDESAHFDVAVHMNGNQAVIEAEPNREHHHDRESTGTVRGMIAQLGQIDALAGFFEEAARQFRALTGYDRASVHRFGPDDADEVVGEALRSGVDKPLGHPKASLNANAPASRSALSFIADVDATPVPIIAAVDRRSRAADVARSTLRAPTANDIDLLNSIGACAGMSIALVIDGRTWGQIACHHRTPYYPSFERRSAAEWYAMMLSMQIEIRELKAKLGK